VTRHLLIALAVLVPFAGLVALGFSMMKDPPPMVFPSPVVRIEPPPEPAPEPPRPEPIRPMPPPLPIEVQVVAPPPPPAAAPVVVAKRFTDLSPEAKRLPIIAAVEPMVMQCFRDVTDHVREPMSVTVAFNTTLEGKFDSVVLRKTSWQDPNLTACIIDSFEDAHFEPGGVALRRQSYTFTFAGPDGGR
jgi:protein TonB